MEFILKIIFVLVLVGVAAFIAHIVDLTRNKVTKDFMSFRESLDLTGLPIVTFKQGNNKFNFILDTGAHNSVIDQNILDTIQYTPLKGTTTGYGIDGKEHIMNLVGITLNYKDKDYPDVFRVLDMSLSFGAFKKDHGVTVHGLLSSSFFEKYKYILDYKELVAYSVV